MAAYGLNLSSDPPILITLYIACYFVIDMSNLQLKFLSVGISTCCGNNESIRTHGSPTLSKRKDLNVNDLFALTWPNFYVTLIYSRYTKHTMSRSLPPVSRSKVTQPPIWSPLAPNRVVIHHFYSVPLGIDVRDMRQIIPVIDIFP